MHYYKFNVSDWVMNTSHLSLEEEAVYLRLVNYYYDSEKPIPLETHSVIRRLRLASHSETVDIVLKEFFTKTDEGWTHSKCDKLLAEYHARAERNRKNGSKGGRKPKGEQTQEKPTGLEVGTDEKPTLVNHKLLTTNQELETNSKDLMSDNSDAVSVLEHLNAVTNSKYKPSTKSHIQNINARLSEGHTVEDCKDVIENQSRLWINDEKMSAYLRPSTLFQTGKFQGYLASARAAKAKTSKHDLSNVKYESRKL